jgi:hypothetical protein
MESYQNARKDTKFQELILKRDTPEDLNRDMYDINFNTIRPRQADSVN